MGYPSVLTAKTWGFYDVLFKGNEFKFQRPYGSYVMEQVLFKISFPAEFHSQTAVEAAMTIHAQLAQQGRKPEDIKRITIRTHEACIRIIDKKDPLTPATANCTSKGWLGRPLRAPHPGTTGPHRARPRMTCAGQDQRREDRVQPDTTTREAPPRHRPHRRITTARS